jgi:hypothetical protein
MAKKKVSKMSDEEVLKHYTSYSEMPEETKLENKKDESACKQEDKNEHDTKKESSSKKVVDNDASSKPTYVKAEIVVDHVMSKRKSAVIPSPSSKQKNK